MLDHGEDTDPEVLGLSFHHQLRPYIHCLNQPGLLQVDNICIKTCRAEVVKGYPETIYALMNVGPTWWNTTQRYLDYNIHWTQYVLPANIKKVLRLKLSSPDSYSRYIIFVSLDIV